MQSRKEEDPRTTAKAVILMPGSLVYDRLMADVKRRKRYLKTASEVRRMADAELGDKSLTEELYKMRGE